MKDQHKAFYEWGGAVIDRIVCPACGDLTCFHSETICPQVNSDALEKLKKENAELKNKLENIISVVDFELPFIEMTVSKLIAENPNRDWILESDFNRWAAILAIRTALAEAREAFK